MPDEILSIADAFNAAKTDLDGSTIPASDDITPDAVEQAPATDVDQSEASNPELQAILDSVDVPEGTEPSIDTTSPDFERLQVDLGEGVKVPLSELKSGYMMQADYTRKTQALAAQAKELEQAQQFYESYKTDPQEFARTVAVTQGWLAEDQRTPVTEVPGVTGPQPEELMQQVEQMVEERLNTDPRVHAARQVEAKATIEAKFTEIEQRLGVVIPDTVRGEIVLDARRRNVYDLDLITDHWMNEQRERNRSGAQLKQGASARPQSAGQYASDEVPQEISSFADAVLAAKAELNARA